MKYSLPISAFVCLLSFHSGLSIANDSAFEELAELKRSANAPFEEQKKEFYAWLDNYLSEYETWRDQYTAGLDQKKLELIDSWGSGEVDSKTKSVEYSKNNQTKQVIDYENNTITVSALVSTDEELQKAKSQLSQHQLTLDGQTLDLSQATVNQASVQYSASAENSEKNFIIEQTLSQMNELDVQAERLVLANTGIPESFIRERAHTKKIELLKHSKDRIANIAHKYQQKRREFGLPEQPTVVNAELASDDTSSKPSHTPPPEQVAKQPTPQPLPEAAQTPKKIVAKPPVTKPVKSHKPKTIVSYTIKLPEGNLKARASQYQPLAAKESKKWDIDQALVMAIMHSESAFRPNAKSHIPAFGLMQVVPTSAGHDVNKRIHNIDSPMPVQDLYQPPKNVATGTAYLHILNDKYLRSIKDDKSRLYCVIAAYNTGAGNVARAFNPDRSTSIKKAAKIINTMPPQQVYDHLVANLPYDETKNYLRKVNSRIALYM